MAPGQDEVIGVGFARGRGTGPGGGGRTVAPGQIREGTVAPGQVRAGPMAPGQVRVGTMARDQVGDSVRWRGAPAAADTRVRVLRAGASAAAPARRSSETGDGVVPAAVRSEGGDNAGSLPGRRSSPMATLLVGPISASDQ